MKIFSMNKRLPIILISFLFAGCITTQYTMIEQKCVYKDEIKVTTNIDIEETKINELYSIDLENRQRKCIVDLSIKTKEWHRLKGEYVYGTNVSEDEACKNAKKNAMKKFVDKNFDSLVTNIQLINCSEVQTDREVIAINVEKPLPGGEDKKGVLSSIWDSMDQKTKDDIITSVFFLIF